MQRPTKVYISGATNGRTSLQFELDVPAVRSSKPVKWNVYGLTDGSIQRKARHDSFVLVGRNFLQYKGVRPGTNRLLIEVTQLGGQTLPNVSVESSTAVLSGLPAPARLTASVDQEQVRIDGDTITVPVLVHNVGGRPERLLGVDANTVGTAVGPFTPSTRNLGEVAAGAQRLVMLEAPVTASGRFDLRIRVDAKTASAATELNYEVKEDRGPWRTRVRWAGGIALFMSASWLISRRRRRRIEGL